MGWFLQAYNFSIKHEKGLQNLVADALSRKYSILTSMQVKVMGFEVLKDLYVDDYDFDETCN